MKRVVYILAALGAVALLVPLLLNSSRPSNASNSNPTGGGQVQAAKPKPIEWAKIRGTPGYWRLGLDTTGVWWLIDGQGKQEFLNAVTTVQPFQKGRDQYGP